MRRVIQSSLFLFILLTLSNACKPRQDYSISGLNDLPEGLTIVKDPVEHDTVRIHEIGVSNNFSFTQADLGVALTGGENVASAKAVLKSTYLYLPIDGKETMVGYILYQMVDNRYIILSDMAIDQSLPDTTIRMLENAMRQQIIDINEQSKLPLLNTIFTAHSRKIELMKRVGFQEIKEIGNMTVPSGVTETGDVIYADGYFKFGDVKKEVVDAFADTYQTTALLNRNKIISDEPELRDRILRSFVDLRDFYRKYPDKHIGTISNKTVEENVLRSLLKKEVGSYILLGDKGGGKTFNLSLIMAKLARGQYPEIDRAVGPYNLLSVDAAQLLANTTYRGQLESKIKSLKDQSLSRPIIIFADEVHRLAGLGKSEGGGSDLFESLKEGMADGSIRIIGSTTPQEYYDTFAGRDAVVDRLYLDEFGLLSKQDVMDIIKYHLGKRGIQANADVIERIYNYSESFEPNGGQVRAKVKFIDDLAADRQLKNRSGALGAAEVMEQARRYFGVGNLVFPEQRQSFLASLAKRSEADKIDAQYMDGVYAGLAEGASKQITMISGPEGSGRSFASQNIADVLHRPRVEISLLPFQTPDKFPELMSRIVSELDKKGSSHKVFAFTHAETVAPDVQRQLIEMFQNGVIVTKVYDANTRRYSTRKIRVPDVLAHFIVDNPAGAAILANASPHKLALTARSQENYRGIVKTRVKALLATTEFSALNLSEAQIDFFVEDFVKENYAENKPFDADAAKLENELRKVVDGFALGENAPAYIRKACDALRAASLKK